MKYLSYIMLFVMLYGASASAGMIELNFFRVTSNSVENVASQLKVEVRDETSAEADFSGIDLYNDEVLFTFYNNVGIASSISEIYFDDGATLFKQVGIFNSLGGFTDFTGPGANPGDLPSGQTVVPEFEATGIFSADAQGNPSNGVDTVADILGISYSLQSGLSFADVQNAFNDGSLRVGMHLRSIGAAGQSDSFVNNPYYPPNPPPGPVPEPATMLLFGTGLLGLAAIRRSRR